jgi:hypothetical protein
VTGRRGNDAAVGILDTAEAPLLVGIGHAPGVAALLQELAASAETVFLALAEELRAAIPPSLEIGAEVGFVDLVLDRRRARRTDKRDKRKAPRVECLGPADAAALEALAQAVPGYRPDMDALGAGRTFGVRAGQRIAAVTTSAWIAESFGSAIVGAAIVHPEHHGEGNAEAAVRAAIDAFPEAIREIASHLPRTAKREIALMKKIGFREVGKSFEAIAIRSGVQVGSAAMTSREIAA